MVNFWVPIAHHCWKNSNLAVLQAIISALQRPSIRQLKSMWNQVTNTTQDLFMRYQVMMDPRNNFQICRGLLRTLETEAHVIPSIDILKAWLNGLSADSREAADMLEQLKYWQADKHPFTVNRFLQQLIQEQLDEARQKASDRDALISLEP
ncbi:ras guanine nucleotide exchange factor domain-containing protein [Flagelloscypha sp. PMI_526]|nr:ras guanine nucleotide exchange factor domain-containing protein [Flagelloscypha sp. PMI_526]